MFNLFRKKKKPKNLKEVLKKFEGLEKKVGEISQELENLEKKSKFNFQKIGLVRYNPFSDVGGNQSFSIALLNNNNDGMVLTSLFGREGNRVYGKSIKKGGSEYSLSDEEKKAIEKAITNS